VTEHHNSYVITQTLESYLQSFAL